MVFRWHEEEVSGQNGFSLALPHLPKIDVAIVGEPTGMQPAIAEKGLMVIDGIAHGKSGHAARNEGVNAIYEALDDLVWLRDHQFRKKSLLLGQHSIMSYLTSVVLSLTYVPTNSTRMNIYSTSCRNT